MPQDGHHGIPKNDFCKGKDRIETGAPPAQQERATPLMPGDTQASTVIVSKCDRQREQKKERKKKRKSRTPRIFLVRFSALRSRRNQKQKKNEKKREGYISDPPTQKTLIDLSTQDPVINLTTQ